MTLTKVVEPAARQALAPFRARLQVENGILGGGFPMMMVMIASHSEEDVSYELYLFQSLCPQKRWAYDLLENTVRRRPNELVSFKLIVG